MVSTKRILDGDLSTFDEALRKARQAVIGKVQFDVPTACRVVVGRTVRRDGGQMW